MREEVPAFEDNEAVLAELQPLQQINSSILLPCKLAHQILVMIVCLTLLMKKTI
jgi:hypothetical protein